MAKPLYAPDSQQHALPLRQGGQCSIPRGNTADHNYLHSHPALTADGEEAVSVLAWVLGLHAFSRLL